MEDMKRKVFNINEGKGFSIVFDNGLTLSTQFGKFNYCDNKDMNIGMMDTTVPNWTTSDNCEIAVWEKYGDWVTAKMYREIKDEDLHDDVIGHVDLNDWLDYLDWCRKQ